LLRGYGAEELLHSAADCSGEARLLYKIAHLRS
jgi:hypothetical protein